MYLYDEIETISKAMRKEKREMDNKAKSIDAEEVPEESLRMLKELYDKGVLSEEEFTEKKKQLLKL